MRTVVTLIGIIAPATAYAAANIPAGNDGVFIWFFLGFFALVVVGQLIPATMLIMGMVKGVTTKTEATTEAR